MRLTADVALVAGGPHTGFGLTDDFESHVYLLDGGGELALIDCGMGTDAGQDALLERVRGLGLDPARIRHLFLTHYHADHAGGAAAYRDRLAIPVSAGADAAPALESADHARTSFASAQALGYFPADYEYRACPVDDRLEDGATRTVGRLTITAIATPGHCAGHVAYLVTGGDRRYLFSGDAVFANGKILLQSIPDCDLGAALASVRRLGATAFDALLPGHGAIVLERGGEHVAAAVGVIERLGVPGGLV